MIMATEKIKIQVGEEVLELTGADKETFLADREATTQAKHYLKRSIRLSKKHAKMLSKS